MSWKTLFLGTTLGMLGVILLGNHPVLAAGQVEQWTRFEHTFASSTRYEDPLREVQLQVTFTSPSGDSRAFQGFWDGQQIWRVRFSPDQQGSWSWRTSCSDAQNRDLHEKSGTLPVRAQSRTGTLRPAGRIAALQE